MIDSTLARLKAAFVTLLTSDPVFSGLQSVNGQPVPVVTEQIGDVASYVQRAIGEMGLVAVIMTPFFKLMDRRVAPLVAIVTISIQVSEFFSINRSASGIGIPAETLVSRIVELTHWKSHGVLSGVSTRSQIIELTGVKLMPSKDARSTVTYIMMYECQLLIKTL